MVSSNNIGFFMNLNNKLESSTPWVHVRDREIAKRPADANCNLTSITKFTTFVWRRTCVCLVMPPSIQTCFVAFTNRSFAPDWYHQFVIRSRRRDWGRLRAPCLLASFLGPESPASPPAGFLLARSSARGWSLPSPDRSNIHWLLLHTLWFDP